LRKQQRDRTNGKKHIKQPNFIVGDYVLVSISNKARQKLKIRWNGPRRIKQVLSDWVYEIEDLITKKLEKVHASRLKFFSEKDLEINADIKNQIAHNEENFIIEEIRDLRLNKEFNKYELLIKWKHFIEEENTWEFLEEIWETSKDVVKKFLSKKTKDKPTKLNAINWLKSNKLY
jgi:hypothetical protein